MPPALDQVFISYSHKDKKWRDALDIHLKPYRRGGSIVSWSDQEIAPGSQWFKEIQSALANSKVAVLLVSPYFLASDFIHEHELGPLLKEAEQGGVKILWVPVYDSAYEKTPLKNYQAVLDPSKPLATWPKAKRDSAWVRICEKIEKAVHDSEDSPKDAVFQSFQSAPPIVPRPSFLRPGRHSTKALAAESLAAQKGNDESNRRLLIDESHRQREWHGYPTADAGYRNALNSLQNFAVKTTAPGTLFSSGLLEQHHVLIMPMPFGTIVEAKEYQSIAQWVYSGNGLLVLGNYLMESHHHTNFNQLVRMFSLEFSQDLVMPLGRKDFRSCMRQAFGTRRELNTIIKPIVKPSDHPVFSGIRRLAFQSSCTVLSKQDADLCVSSCESFSVMKAVGPKNESGKILQIQDYILDKRAKVCFMAGTSHGRGRVLAIGSWKVFLNEFTEDPSLDNGKLFQNSIAWLASSA